MGYCKYNSTQNSWAKRWPKRNERFHFLCMGQKDWRWLFEVAYYTQQAMPPSTVHTVIIPHLCLLRLLQVKRQCWKQKPIQINSNLQSNDMTEDLLRIFLHHVILSSLVLWCNLWYTIRLATGADTDKLTYFIIQS